MIDQRTEAQKLADLNVLQKVRSGIQFLEQTYGPDWVDYFTDEDLKHLDLSHGAYCVLGTIHNHIRAETDPLFEDRQHWDGDGYWKETAELGIGDDEQEEATRYGFFSAIGNWDDLTVAWRQSITMLKKAKGMMR